MKNEINVEIHCKHNWTIMYGSFGEVRRACAFCGTIWYHDEQGNYPPEPRVVTGWFTLYAKGEIREKKKHK